MINLDKQSKRFSCVINFPLSHHLSTILDKLDELQYTYFMIKHYKDYKDNGELKTPHIHIGLILPKRQRAQTILWNLCSVFGVNENQVSVSEMLSVSGALQYLTHKNNIEKAHYDISEIKTNMSKEQFDILYNSSTSDLQVTFDTLFELIVTNNSTFDNVVRTLGCEKYIHYRTLIFDIYRIYRNYDFTKGAN